MKTHTAIICLLAICSSSCRRGDDPERAAEDVGAEVGAAAEDAGEAIEREARGVRERLEGKRLYRCDDGTEFSVDYEEDGSTAVIEIGERGYRMQLQPEAGQFRSEGHKFWTVGEDRATLDLEGQPPLQNCRGQ